MSRSRRQKKMRRRLCACWYCSHAERAMKHRSEKAVADAREQYAAAYIGARERINAAANLLKRTWGTSSA